MSTEKEWTLMFYFASDNPLAPSIVSQLKALKQAGFHPSANVIARFDPHADKTPAHVFDVNHIDKLKARGEPKIGYVGYRPNDPFVQNLVFDKLWGDDEIENLIRDSLDEELRKDYQPPRPSEEMGSEQSPRRSLESFLDFCLKEYPARRYMLVILGHGIVVGNDLFLFDDHAPEQFKDIFQGQAKRDDEGRPRNSLLLKDLGDILSKRFGVKEGERSRLELVGFHSCSMSALEVAYELRGSANYMLASQGPAFVGSWPYKQILMGLFNGLENGATDVKESLRKIFYYCLYNSYDFQMAGYSFDLTLCDLNKVGNATAPLSMLSAALKAGLSDKRAQELILLAHWESQSYWQENYTDIYDFCFCLLGRCLKDPGAGKGVLKDIQEACDHVMGALQRGVEGDDDNLIIRSGFAGPTYQYSHGLSLFFPWSEPVNGFFSKEYRTYNINVETGWDEFLNTYFKETMRPTHGEEVSKDNREKSVRNPSLAAKLLEEITVRIINEGGQLSKGGASDATGKGGSSDASGGDCTCPSIKNHPSFTRARSGALSPNFGERFDLEP